MHILTKICQSALPLCVAEAKTPRSDLSTIEVSMVSDARIARLHEDFMQIKGATDVITFPYGEIIVSADTAEREAKKQKWSTETELALYVIHGILHLYGWDDQSPAEAIAMSQCQENILKSALSFS